MSLILIPIAWLAVLTLFIALCRMAARGDLTQTPAAEQSFPAVVERAAPLVALGAQTPAAEQSFPVALDGLTVWEEPAGPTLQDARRAGTRRLTARDVRSRAGRFAAGS